MCVPGHKYKDVTQVRPIGAIPGILRFRLREEGQSRSLDGPWLLAAMPQPCGGN